MSAHTHHHHHHAHANAGHTHRNGATEMTDPARTAVDPVCGMSVAAVPASLHVEHKGTTVYFCGPGCMQAFTALPDDYT